MNEPIERLFLWGMMGVGKSSLAKKLAQKLGWESIDLDDLIEEKVGHSISDIFQSQGEEYFRQREAETLRTLMSTSKMVVAVGGGTPCFHSNDEWMLQAGLCIWLDAPAKMLLNRLINAKTERPLISKLSDEELLSRIESLIEERTSYYMKAPLIFSINNIDQKGIIAVIEGLIRDKSSAQA